MADIAWAFVKFVSRDRRTVAAFLNETERLASSPDANTASVVEVCGPNSRRTFRSCF